MTMVPRFLDKSIEESMDYSPRSLEVQIQNVAHFVKPRLPSRVVPKNFSTISVYIVHTCHLTLHVDLLSMKIL